LVIKKPIGKKPVPVEATVLEVKNIEGLGTTVDIILIRGELSKGDTIVLAGSSGPIVTQVRALLTPKPMREIRVKGEYVNHPKISTSMGIKLCAPGLENAIAGTSLFVGHNEDEIEDLKADVEDEFEDQVGNVLGKSERADVGVYVQASTVGSLEALLGFLKSINIPVCQVNIGVVNKKDVKKAAIAREKGKPEYSVILAFDVKIAEDAQKEANRPTVGVRIFSADIIYHLENQFMEYWNEIKEMRKRESAQDAVFPCVLKICNLTTIFHKKNPIIIGVDVLEGVLKKGTPLCIPEQGNLEIGRVESIENNKVNVDSAKKGEAVTVKIVPNSFQAHVMLGRHFVATNLIYSHVTRQSIDVLKESYMEEMNATPGLWSLIIAFKKVLKID